MGLKPLPSSSRHKDIQGTRTTLHFSLRSALALRAFHPKPGFETQVFSDLQTLEDACFDRPCHAVQAYVWGRLAGVPLASKKRSRQLQSVAPRKASDRQRHSQEGRHRVIISVLITQTQFTVSDSGGGLAEVGTISTVVPSFWQQPAPALVASPWQE